MTVSSDMSGQGRMIDASCLLSLHQILIEGDKNSVTDMIFPYLQLSGIWAKPESENFVQCIESQASKSKEQAVILNDH